MARRMLLDTLVVATLARKAHNAIALLEAVLLLKSFLLLLLLLDGKAELFHLYTRRFDAVDRVVQGYARFRVVDNLAFDCELALVG